MYQLEIVFSLIEPVLNDRYTHAVQPRATQIYTNSSIAAVSEK